MTASKRNTAYIVAIATALVFVTFFTLGATTQFILHQIDSRQSQRPEVFWEAWELLEQEFYGSIPSAQERTYGAIRGALAVLDDPYTILLEPQTGEVERNRLTGAYGGIGVDLWRNSDGAVVLSPFPASPAETAGVRTGDVLLEIDGLPVDTRTLDDIRVQLRGPAGSTVTATLSRPPTPPFQLVIARAEILLPSVTYRTLDRDPAIGYLHITTFTERTPRETEQALQSLLDSQVEQLVLDLRGNGGGLIQPAVSVAGLFLDGGVVMHEVQREGQQTLHASDGGLAADLPLLVLVDRSTASAAEIVAGALQARQRGPLIGQPTYGKGSVQRVYTLSDGSALHVTAAIWLLPGQEPIADSGLTPDIPVVQEDTLLDTALERAIDYFQTGE
ncbi:MAG: PDZ domain-containing protein [Anaerolineae bacterium]|nr:PDZ domain-containing protein [Anaerolineae bacterium]